MPTHPNIIFILADDMGYGDLSCLNDESKIHTPCMDRMSAEGVTFTDAHASSSVCTPSRYGILTGRYAWRGRLKRIVLGPYAKPLIENDLTTLPQFLKDNDYDTACIGKWHLGMNWPANRECATENFGWASPEMSALANDIDYTKPITNSPVSYGFDYYFGVDVPNFPPYCFIENDRTVGIPEAPKPDSMYGIPGPMIEGWDLEAIMPGLTQKAVDYVDRKAGGDKPFFLYFPMTGPHTPIAPTKKFRGKSDAGVYGDFVMQLDDTVGQINTALTRNGIDSNTLVIITSDNGSPGRNGSAEDPGTVIETFGHNPSWILRGMKGDTWDGGHRVPLIAKWPDQIEAGTSCGELVCLLDLMATCAGVINTQLPDGAARDSLNILPYLKSDKVDAPIREEIIHHGLTGLYAIRKNEWKLIAGTGSGGFSPNPELTIYDPEGQLYNMAEDIRERKNRYAELPEKVFELTDLLTQYRCQV